MAINLDTLEVYDRAEGWRPATAEERGLFVQPDSGVPGYGTLLNDSPHANVVARCRYDLKPDED